MENSVVLFQATRYTKLGVEGFEQGFE